MYLDKGTRQKKCGKFHHICKLFFFQFFKNYQFWAQFKKRLKNSLDTMFVNVSTLPLHQ